MLGAPLPRLSQLKLREFGGRSDYVWNPVRPNSDDAEVATRFQDEPLPFAPVRVALRGELVVKRPDDPVVLRI